MATVVATLGAGPGVELASAAGKPANPGSPGRGGQNVAQKILEKPFTPKGFPAWGRTAAQARQATLHAPTPPAATKKRQSQASVEPAGAAKAAPRQDATRDAVRWSEGHAGGRQMALALTAAGIGYGGTVDRNDIVRAGHSLGVKFGPRIDAGELDRVAALAWQLGGLRMAAAGLDFEGQLDPHDLIQRAAELGIDVGSQVDPGDVTAVLAAGQQGMAEMLRTGGFPFGDVVNLSDLRTAGRLHGVKLGRTLRPADARAVATAVAQKGDPKRTLLYAKIGKVDLHLPGRRPEYIGFHQSSTSTVLPHRRWGISLSEFLPSRSRGTHRAGAVDVTMPPGDRVYAPVSGKVVEAKGYALYGRYRDEMLRIVPDGDTRMITTVLHVQGLNVKAGDRVVAGETVIAGSARKFPFWSQIDAYSGKPWGHVHIETRFR